MKRQVRPPTPEEQAFYAGFTNGGVLKRTGGSGPGGIHDLLRTLERFEQYLVAHPRADTFDVQNATHELVDLLRKHLA